MSENNLERKATDKLHSVFIIVNTFGRGGAEMSLAILANELAKRGRSVTLIALWKEQNSYNFDWVINSGVKLHVLNESKNLFVSLYKLSRMIHEARPQLIYSAMLYANFVSQICAKFLGNKHIASVRINPAVFYTGSILKRISFALIMFMQNNIVFISRKALNEYLATIYGRFLRRKRLFVLHNPVDGGHGLNGVSLEKKFNANKKKINDFLAASRMNQNVEAELHFVMVSRLVGGKGIMEILEKIRIPFENKKLSLSIYGAGPLENEIHKYIQSEFENKNVVLKGFCADIDAIFAESDFIIFPSRSEGFGRAPFEALLRGNFVLCNKEVSIVNEFLNEPMVWIDYSEPFDLYKCLEQFSELEPLECVDQIKLVSDALSPHVHVLEFEKIASCCLENGK